MIYPLLKGILMGLTIAISLGPGFFAIFHTSVSKGFKAGIVIATGILISDLVLIVLSYFGLESLISKQQLIWFGIAGGLILFISGMVTLFRKPVSIDNSSEFAPVANSKNHLLLLQGFILNISNPLNLFFWLGVLGFAGNTFGINSRDFFIFMCGLILTAFTADLFKSFLAGFLTQVLNTKYIAILHKVTGIVFLLAGAFVIYKVL